MGKHNVLESEIEAFLKSRVEHFGGICIKLPALFMEGIPDRLVLLPNGKMGFAELKRPYGGRPAPLQLYWQDRIRKLGFVSEIVKNKDEVNSFLTKVMKCEEDIETADETKKSQDLRRE